MTLTRLSLSNFRSYRDAVLAPGSGFVVLTGENGAGKTNVLEAVSLLVPGRGLRGVALSEMARSGGDGGFGVSAALDDIIIGTGTIASAPERRIDQRQGKERHQAKPRRKSKPMPVFGTSPRGCSVFRRSAAKLFERRAMAERPKGTAGHSGGR
jgi:recombinational DNA repair ATPase RecF